MLLSGYNLPQFLYDMDKIGRELQALAQALAFEEPYPSGEGGGYTLSKGAAICILASVELPPHLVVMCKEFGNKHQHALGCDALQGGNDEEDCTCCDLWAGVYRDDIEALLDPEYDQFELWEVAK